MLLRSQTQLGGERKGRRRQCKRNEKAGSREAYKNGGKSIREKQIGIWEERKVFGSRGQMLKEELVGRHPESNSRIGKQMSTKLKHLTGSTLDKIVSGYQFIYGQLDEDTILSKCRNAMSFLEKVDKEVGTNINSGQFHGTQFVEELQGQHTVLRGCIQQLTAIESSTASLVSHLREALKEQEFKLDQVRSQLQAAQSQSDSTDNICRQLLKCNNAQSLAEQGSKEAHTSIAPHSLISGDREQSAPVMFTQTAHYPEKSGNMEEDPRKSAAAAVAAKLTASTSSAQMLSYVLSSLASEGVIGNPLKESSGDYPSEKRAKLENDQSSYVPQNTQPPPVVSFPHSESLGHGVSNNLQYNPNEAPPPPSSPPPLPPLPPMSQYPVPQFMQTSGSINNASYSYGMTLQAPSTMPGYYLAGAPPNGASPYIAASTNSYQGFQGPDGNFYNQPSSMPMAPISRQ